MFEADQIFLRFIPRWVREQSSLCKIFGSSLRVPVNNISMSELTGGLYAVVRQANDTCRKWSGGTLDLRSPGSEFILHFEVARYFAELTGKCGGQSIDFNRAAVELNQLSNEQVSSRVSGNTKRLYLILRHTNKKRAILIRSQRYSSPAYFVAETKGAARAILRHSSIDAAIIIGVGGWRSENASQNTQKVYDVLKAAFGSSSMSGLRLDLPDNTEQPQSGEAPSLLLARIVRVT